MKITKRIIAIFCILTLTASLFIPAFAEDAYVSYVGGAEKFIFLPGSKYSPTDLFDNFKDVMPGDTLTQKIVVKNDVSNDVKIKVYMRSLGGTSEVDGFLSQMKLTVKQVGDSIMYQAPADQAGDLSDWVYLGLIYSGGTIDLDVKLDVPLTLGNEFQSAEGHVLWEFKIEELPVEPDDPSPPTGDQSVTGPLIVVMAVTGLFLIVLFGRRKKKEEEEYEA